MDALSLVVHSSGSTVYAGTTGSLYKSTNNGDTWTDIGKMNVASVSGNGQKVWAVSQDNSNAGRTTNIGTNWSNAHFSSAGAAVSSAAIFRNPYTN